MAERWELVRCSRGAIEKLLDEPERVHLVGMERHDDGTVELVFRTPDYREAADRGVVLELALRTMADDCWPDGESTMRRYIEDAETTLHVAAGGRYSAASRRERNDG